MVSLTLCMEGIADKVIDFTIHTLQDAVSALHNVFRYIVDQIEDLIDWLKSLFDWHGIWNTKKVIAKVTRLSFQALVFTCCKRRRECWSMASSPTCATVSIRASRRRRSA